MVQVLINIYEIHELTPKAKERAISKHYNFLASEGCECENEEGELVVEDYDPSEEEVIENIELNEYMFYADGEMAHCCTYTGGPKAGTTELTIGEDIYIL